MFTFLILGIIIFFIVMISIALLSVGGTLFVILASDLLAAIGFVTFVVWLFKRRKKKE